MQSKHFSLKSSVFSKPSKPLGLRLEGSAVRALETTARSSFECNLSACAQPHGFSDPPTEVTHTENLSFIYTAHLTHSHCHRNSSHKAQKHKPLFTNDTDVIVNVALLLLYSPGIPHANENK